MIIAELCGNHLGDKVLLFDMVSKAKAAGCMFVKVQAFFAEDLNLGFQDTKDRVKQCELSFETMKEMVDFCARIKITPMVSVYTSNYLKDVVKAGFRWIKIGSADSYKKGLIAAYKAVGCHVIYSTGGKELSDVPKLFPVDGVLHCVSIYPHSPYEANLTRMIRLKQWFNNVGFSDHSDPQHTYWNLASETAILMGAEYIERHFTLLGRDKTKDGPVSVDYEQLKELCEFDRGRHKNPRAGLFSQKQHYKEKELIKNYETRWRFNV